MTDRMCDSIAGWMDSILDHGVQKKHFNFAWDDIVGFDYGLRCLECDERFLIRDMTIKADPSPRARLLEGGLKCRAGRDTLVETVQRTIKQRLPPRTAWSAVLEDDEE